MSCIPDCNDCVHVRILKRDCGYKSCAATPAKGKNRNWQFAEVARFKEELCGHSGKKFEAKS